MSKKLKITIESEGQPTQILEAHGIAAALLTDGEDSEHYGLQCCVIGKMSTADLLRLHDGVEGELADALKKTIVDHIPAEDLLRILLGGNKDGSHR